MFYTQFDRAPTSGVVFKKQSMTEQSHKNEYDINRLISRATKTGVLATADQIRSVYFGDFSGVDQALENHLKLKEAEEHFMSLPSAVRDYFANDPKRLLKALSDSSQLGKLVDLGLVKAPVSSVGTPDQPIQVSGSDSSGSDVS